MPGSRNSGCRASVAYTRLRDFALVWDIPRSRTLSTVADTDADSGNSKNCVNLRG